MMSKIIDAEAAKLAGLQIDLLQKLRSGSRTLEQFEWFINLNPEALKAHVANNFQLATQSKAVAGSDSGVGMRPIEWFYPRNGLFFFNYKSFKDRLLTVAISDEVADISGCDYVDLIEFMDDSEIVAKCLGSVEEAKKDAMTMKQVQSYLCNQWNCSDGQLLIDGNANLFHVLGKGGKLFVVGARRSGRSWSLREWELSERNDGFFGRRVFRNKRQAVFASATVA